MIPNTMNEVLQEFLDCRDADSRQKSFHLDGKVIAWLNENLPALQIYKIDILGLSNCRLSCA